MILARAWAYRDYRSKAFVIYADETPVGMAMYYDIEDPEGYDFSQFFIDSRYQGNGYGKEAARQVLELMKADGKSERYGCATLNAMKQPGKCMKDLDSRTPGMQTVMR